MNVYTKADKFNINKFESCDVWSVIYNCIWIYPFLGTNYSIWWTYHVLQGIIIKARRLTHASQISLKNRILFAIQWPTCDLFKLHEFNLPSELFYYINMVSHCNFFLWHVPSTLNFVYSFTNWSHILNMCGVWSAKFPSGGIVIFCARTCGFAVDFRMTDFDSVSIRLHLHWF